MKTLILSLALALSFASCSTEPNIEIRQTNPQLGVNEVGTKFMRVINGNMDKTPFAPEQKSIVYNPKSKSLLIDGLSYEVVESTFYTITYKDNAKETYIIEFNTGYVWQDGKTQTKFDIYKLGNKDKDYTVYTYKN